MQLHDGYDLAILGGGLAGLTLAIQLQRARPATNILVVERHAHPVPEAAFKVGEATVELGAHYLSNVVGMKEHLKNDQLLKMGLRLFITAGDNRDITRRVEIGPAWFGLVPTYQIDRGRFENALAETAQALGVTFRDSSSVEQISLGTSTHTLIVRSGEDTQEVRARWIVDASGRASLLKRKLGLGQQVGHDANAAWFRIGERIDIDTWSDDPAWQDRLAFPLRWRSTNHLMGKGYWVWLIPLASGSTSIGIVADSSLHPFSTINRFDRALDWLREHEPQCARAVEDHRHQLQDFRVMKRYAYGCEQNYSADRWCLTGEAGFFTDPYYSPGSDFIAIGNTFITDLISCDLNGDAFAWKVDLFNRSIQDIFRINLRLYEGQMSLMGNAQVMAAKVVWDFAIYWGFLALLGMHNKFIDVEFMVSAAPRLRRMSELNERVQDVLVGWGESDRQAYADVFFDYGNLDFLFTMLRETASNLDDDELRERLAFNVEVLEVVAVEIARKAGATVNDPPVGTDTDASSLRDVASQLQLAWLAVDKTAALAR